LSLRAIGLWTVCRSYAAQHETDGYLAADIVREKVGRHGRGSRVVVIAQELVDAGLWEVAIGGWMIHDYADWNITKVQKDAKRVAAAERQRRHRKPPGSLTEASRAPHVPLAQASEVIIPAQPVASRRDSRAIDVDVEREERLETSSLVARTAQTIVANWIDHYPGKPPSRVLGQLAAEVKRLLDEGYPWDVVNAAVAEWHRRSLHPSALASVLDQMQRPAGIRTPQMGSVDQKVAEALRIRDEIRAEREARELAGPAIDVIATITELGGSA
jgi:hypothetical protein